MARHFRRQTAVIALLLALVACGHEPNPNTPVSLAGKAVLAVTPSLQQTPVWCWAASAEMVFRYYGLPNLNPGGNYQCGIVGAWFNNTACFFDCGQCRVGIGARSNQQQLLIGYGHFARAFGVQSRVLTASLIFRALAAAEIKAEIDGGRPIVIGISPGQAFALPNLSQHIAVLIGYDFTSAEPRVIVNDPFPFGIFPYSTTPHPYLSRGAVELRSGQYLVSLSAVTTGLGWGNTIYGIQ